MNMFPVPGLSPRRDNNIGSDKVSNKLNARVLVLGLLLVCMIKYPHAKSH